MKLLQAQRDFRAWLAASSAAAGARLAGGRQAGLEVYRNNYRAQLVGCLRETYARVQAWIGEEAFLEAAIAHIENHPPQAWTLDAYGADFGDTLAALYPHQPDLHELAWIDAAMATAFVAADAEPPAPDALAAVDWDTARLRLAPSFACRACATNAAAIWTALDAGGEPPAGEMLAEAGGLLIWRQGYAPRLKPVDALEYAAVLSLRADGSFAAACGLLVDRLGPDQGVARAGALLGDWLGRGLIAGVGTPGPADRG